ncbi:DUF7344 domain-containing protein [Halegenticoccus tardaugens]|uniref:DUF7344 domain-containing protein n=1 Tax=Halegenticoccus tardaugens TaxID=2071624 RepID=UPI00100C291B|nr:hypothetical protein [Halegenticoccus tardaugens]
MAAPKRQLAEDGGRESLARVLADRRRQHVVEALDSLDDDVSLGTLVDDIRARETREADGRAVDRQTVALSLHHVHLPKLADAGVLAYDLKRKRVTRDRQRVSDLLRMAEDAYRVLSSEV